MIRPRRALLSAGLLVLGSLSLGAACSTFASPTQKTLSFAQMQSLNPGVEGEWILGEYPFATEVGRRPDGSLAKLGYWVTDPQGKSRPLVLHFDGAGVLSRKQYGGPLVRPPPRNDTDIDLGFG